MVSGVKTLTILTIDYCNSIDHHYSDDGKLPDVFLVTIDNNSVVVKNIPFPPPPKATRGRRNVERRYSTGRVWIPAKDGDGIKFCDESYVRYYFPFSGELFDIGEAAMTEARFLRYMDGYRREILPDLEKQRESEIISLAREDYAEDRAKRIRAHIEGLDQFIVWLNER